MSRRTLLTFLTLLPFLLVSGGCASLHPHLTVLAERDVAETRARSTRQRAETGKAGASISINLP